jgi:hypothetical protein
MPDDPVAKGRIEMIDQLVAGIEKQKQAQASRQKQIDDIIAQADREFDGANYKQAQEDYKKAQALDPSNTYIKQRIARIEEINRILASSKKTEQTGSSSGQVSRLSDLQFKNESEKKIYLEGLKEKYPEGITLEIYREKSRETYRYIVIRKDEISEFRKIRYVNFDGEAYSVNGKPITQMYFLSQVKPREGEQYKEMVMQ